MKYETQSSDASFQYVDSSASNLKYVEDSAEKGNLSDIMKNSFLVISNQNKFSESDTLLCAGFVLRGFLS